MDCPYEVRVSETFGRFLVATRDLKPRELIISEQPIIVGPTDEPGSIPLCLGCCAKMTENQYSRCSKCRFPVCSPDCEKQVFHAENECEVFSANKVTYPPPFTTHILNKSIIILRCLLLKEKDPKKWSELMTMSDNRASRRNRPNCITADDRILDNFSKFLPGEKSFDVEEVLRISGILDVNAHAFPVKVNGKIVASKCHLYYKTCLIAHSCSPNASWAPDKFSKSTLVIRTNVTIPQGEIITVAYDDSDLLYGTLRRLIPMEISGMFICKCKRCLDPTELGTYLSALKCEACPKGYLLSVNPTNSFSDWRCDICAKTLNEIEVSEIIDEAEEVAGFPKQNLLTDPDEHVDLLKEYVKDYCGIVLHPNHYVIQEVNLRIIRSLCFNLEELSDEELEDFLSRCKNLLELSEILIPGFGESRAFLQYHYFRALLENQERKYGTAGENGGDGVKENGKIKLNCNNNSNISIKRISNWDDYEDCLKAYKQVLRMQQAVLTFLQEKFIASNRIDYVLETMDFVKEQISKVELHPPEVPSS